MLQVRGVRGPTASLLAEMLGERGLLGKPIRGVVNYGYAPVINLPTLNANAGHLNKYEELAALDNAGARTVPFSIDPRDIVPPIFGRALHHTRGTDICIHDGAWAGVCDSDYYTGLVPKQAEFRVWVFRGKHLATYEKKLVYPQYYGKRGRSKEIWNWANGFAYQFVEPNEVDKKLKSLANEAIAALGLDFGAADILLGADRRYYVLEVNTAPGTQGEPRQGITSLVNCIQRWAEKGFPER